jgi:hypothetical protein
MPRSIDSEKLGLWRERFDRFSHDQMAVGPFCARERVSVASFYYWRRKVGQVGSARNGRGTKARKSDRMGPDRSRTDRRSVFHPATVVPAGSAELTTEAAPAVRIELPCGTRIELGAEDLEVVRAVVHAIRWCDNSWRLVLP